MIRIEFNSAFLEFTWRFGRKSQVGIVALGVLDRQLTDIFENQDLTIEMRNRAYSLLRSLRKIQGAIKSINGDERFNRETHNAAKEDIKELVILAAYVDDETHKFGIEHVCTVVSNELNVPSVNFEFCGGRFATTIRPKPKLSVPKFLTDWRAN